MPTVIVIIHMPQSPIYFIEKQRNRKKKKKEISISAVHAHFSFFYFIDISHKLMTKSEKRAGGARRLFPFGSWNGEFNLGLSLDAT